MRDISQSPTPADLLNRNNRLLLWGVILLGAVLCCEIIIIVQHTTTTNLIIEGFNKLFNGFSVIINSIQRMKVY